MGRLLELDIADSYRSNTSDIVGDFYIPTLDRSIRYDRAVGYFTSSSLSLIAEGLDGLARNGGRIRLIASPHLTPEDIEAIAEGYELRDVIERAVARELDPAVERPTLDPAKLALVSRLIASGMLEIKIAIVRREERLALYHEKIGLIADTYGDRIAFSGSLNETRAAYIDNFESIEVFKSWVPGDARRVNRIANDFESLWTNQTLNSQSGNEWIARRARLPKV
jgi:HKD family nuclease